MSYKFAILAFPEFGPNQDVRGNTDGEELWSHFYDTQSNTAPEFGGSFWMHTATARVTLAVGAAPYQKTLAASLASAGILRRVLTSGPNLEILEPADDRSLVEIKRFPQVRIANKLIWGVWTRLPATFRPGSPVMATVLLKDHLWSRWIPDCSVFHGWMGQSLLSFRAARREGAVTLLENAGRHPGDFHKAPLEECERFGIKPADRSPLLPNALIERMKREYEICDWIVVPSKGAYDSFAKFGLAHKAVVLPTGVDAAFFSPPQISEPRRGFRACFVGRVELAKGAGDLLLAWKRLGLANAELVLAGEVRPEMRALLRIHANPSVRLKGVVRADEVADIYRESDVFVFPSVNEGLAQVLLEAMATGLPLVATDVSGAEDCISDGREGLIVPARDVDRLAEAILWCYQHRDDAASMGRAARAKIEKQFTLDHYNQRMIALYRSVSAVSV